MVYRARLRHREPLECSFGMTNPRMACSSDPTIRTLSTPLSPLPGESLRGFVARACSANWLPNSWGLLKHLGLRNRNVVNISESPHIDLPALASATGAQESEVRSRFYPELALSHGEFFGVPLSRQRIDYRRRRFAPGKLASDAWHLAVWELRDLPFCLASWEMLQDTCPCPFEEPTQQRWTRTLTRVDECDRCGEPLARLTSHVIPHGEREGLGLLRDMLAPALGEVRDLSALPTQIRAVCIGRILETIIQLSQIARGHLIPGLPPEFAYGVTRLRAGCIALRDWPNGFHSEWIDPSATESAVGARRHAYLALGTKADTSLVELKLQLKEKRERRRRGLSTAGKPGDSTSSRRATRTKEQKDNRRLREAATRASNAEAKALLPIGLRPASELARLDPDTLLAAQEAGLLTHRERQHGKRTLPAFDRHEVLILAEGWKNRISASSLAFEFGISLFGVEQLAAMGALPPDAPHLQNEGPHFTRASVDKLIGKLVELARESIDEGITLADALRHTHLRPKSWGPAIALLLGNKIPFALGQTKPFRMDRLIINRNDTAKLGTLTFERSDFPEKVFCQTMVQRDVCECFNLLEKDGQHLLFLSHSGKMPRLYDRHAVEAFRSKALHTYEIARLTDSQPRKVTRRLEQAQAVPLAWKFYDRRSIGEIFAI